jgi:hypothetical protein
MNNKIILKKPKFLKKPSKKSIEIKELKIK